jgi:hypothetical protein
MPVIPMVIISQMQWMLDFGRKLVKGCGWAAVDIEPLLLWDCHGFVSCSQEAASKGILLEVKRIIDEPLKESKASIDESDDVRRTPLMMAAKDGSPDVIETLVEAGAEVNSQSVRILMRIRNVVHFFRRESLPFWRYCLQSSGHSPLMLAAKYGHILGVMRLLAYNADGMLMCQCTHRHCRDCSAVNRKIPRVVYFDTVLFIKLLS